jgi:hypothetical protein
LINKERENNKRELKEFEASEKQNFKKQVAEVSFISKESIVVVK